MPVPFGELAWDHARRGLGPGAAEEEIADAVAALLRRASAGPEGQGNAGDEQARPQGRRPHQGSREPRASQARHPAPRPAEQRRHAAGEVIPMPIFDPFAEADKPW